MRISDWSSDVCSSDLKAVDRLVPQCLDLRIGEQAVLENLFGTQRIAAVDQRHVVAVVGEVERFLDRGVAAADHDDLRSEERRVGKACVSTCRSRGVTYP